MGLKNEKGKRLEGYKDGTGLAEEMVGNENTSTPISRWIRLQQTDRWAALMFGGNNKIMRCSTFFRVLIKMFTRLRKRMQEHGT